jgi:leucyl-tRNA synthetase
MSSSSERPESAASSSPSDRYDHQLVERKWQERWRDADLYRADVDHSKPKFYGLEMFPYPSGAGLSVGHFKNYAPTDAFLRYKAMRGFNVLHPMGWDAFGQPAENEAIKRQRNPREMVREYAANYKRQLNLIGMAYDWSREINSSDPEYYRWTQWIFLYLFKQGLAYRGNAPVNWCPVDKTVLANEEVVNGRCWRCETIVEKRMMPQWFFKITAYAERLLADLDTVDWPEGIKAMQRNWIGRSEGAEVDFPVSSDWLLTSSPESVPLVAGPLTEIEDVHIDELLHLMVDAGATNLSITAGSPPTCRLNGESRPMPYAILTGTDTQRLIYDIMTDWQIEEFESVGRFNFFYLLAGRARLAVKAAKLAVHVSRDQGIVTAAIQLLSTQTPGPTAGEDISEYNVPSIRVFTTRPDTLWGATFMALAPEHPLVEAITLPEHRGAVQDYVLRTQRETEIDRQAEGKEKSGVWTGAHAINPVNGEQIPIWIADYVLMGYGTGAIMAVPAHDQRDFEFARKFGLPVVPIYQTDPANPIQGEEMTAATTHEGVVVDSGQFDGLPATKETMSKVAYWLEEIGSGKPVVTYRLRDWLISRQRYWGAPIPIVHCGECGEVAVPDDQLPVRLPDIESYAPSGTGESPLATIPEWVNTTCPTCGGPARRETDTMGGFACSSWYFLRFADPHDDTLPWSRESADYWLPVDLYAGGSEHAVMHLLYARFWTKVLYDGSLIGFTEPFKTLRNQGSMLAWTPGRKPARNEDASGEDDDGAEEHVIDWKVLKPEELATFPPDQIIWRWARQSKSKGNVVTPDEVAKEFGADALRTYEMFVAPFEEDVQWSKEGIRGSAKFLGRVYRLVDQYAAGFDPLAWREKVAGSPNTTLRRKTHQTIAKVGEDIEGFRFNTAVAALMEWVNMIYDVSAKTPREQRDAAIDEAVETLVVLIAPIAPHLADELWERLGHKGFLYKHSWPNSDAAIARADEITLVVQINGKVRDKLTAPADSDAMTLEALALASPRIQELLDGQPPKKVIVVPGKLVNFVV